MSVFSWLSEKPMERPMKKEEYQKSLAKLLKKIEEAKRKWDSKKAAWLCQMASVMARRAGEWDDSIKYGLLAAEQSLKAGGDFNAGWAYRSASMAAKEKQDWKAAAGYSLEAADIFHRTGSHYAEQWCRELAAYAYEKQGDFPKAISQLEKSYEIAPDPDIHAAIERIREKTAHPLIEQYADKAEAYENEPVKFEAVIKNSRDKPVLCMVVSDKGGKMTREVGTVRPGETNVLSAVLKGKVGLLESPFSFAAWKTENGQPFSSELKPLRVRVKPKIEVNCYMDPQLVIDRKSEFVVLVKNLSTSPVYDVKIDATFGRDIDIEEGCAKEFAEILPGEQKGTYWNVTPRVLGKMDIADVTVTVEDENGTENSEKITSLVFEILEKPARPKPESMPAPEAVREHRDYFEDKTEPFTMSEAQYMEMKKGMWSQQKGYTVSDIDLDAAMEHIKEKCRSMFLVAEHETGKEAVMIFSFRDRGAVCVLGVIIRKEEARLHMIFRLYSENRDVIGPLLEKISGLIRYTLVTEKSATEIGKIEIKKVFNIIDSVIQRSQIGAGGEEGEVTEKKTRIRDSIVQKTET